MGKVVVTRGLDTLLRDLRDMDLVVDHAVTRQLAEGVIKWKQDIRGTGQAPGEGTSWPIGTFRVSERTGKKYYVEPGKGKRSGRSLNAWRVRQGRGVVRAINRARDPRTGKEYASWVHLRGREKGSAVEDAWGHWEKRFDEAAEVIIQIIADEAEGR